MRAFGTFTDNGSRHAQGATGWQVTAYGTDGKVELHAFGMDREQANALATLWANRSSIARVWARQV